MGRIRNSEIVKSGDVSEAEKHGSQTRQIHSKKERNKTVISSIDNSEAVHEDGRVKKYKEEKDLKRGKARASNRQMQNSCQEQIQQLKCHCDEISHFFPTFF